MLLLGWGVTPEPADSGVPEIVGRVLAAGLTAVARVTFPCSTCGTVLGDEWARVGEDQVRSLDARGAIERVKARLGGIPAEIGMVSTRSPASACRLFDDPAYPWWMQGQVAMLSEGEAPPRVDRATLIGLIEDGDTNAAALQSLGIGSVLRPGVDGDVAGLWSSTEAFGERLATALESASRAAGCEWEIVSEAEFMAR
jgi:hypothetical protein